AKIDLEWTPTSTVRSTSGELAVTVGDYKASFERDGDEVSGGGAFLSVWRRDAGGHWQLAGEGFTPPDIYAESAATDGSTSSGPTP
ncbi:MAG: nuclear transport factor 2 family protein, partial [Acidobacteriota bacterium]